jgi:hypothetical protein
MGISKEEGRRWEKIENEKRYLVHKWRKKKEEKGGKINLYSNCFLNHGTVREAPTV